MKYWLTILSIKLGIVKLICAEPSYDSITRYRMNKLGIRFKDIANTLKTSADTIIDHLGKVNLTQFKSQVLRIRINNYLTQQEKMR